MIASKLRLIRETHEDVQQEMMTTRKCKKSKSELMNERKIDDAVVDWRWNEWAKVEKDHERESECVILQTGIITRRSRLLWMVRK